MKQEQLLLMAMKYHRNEHPLRMAYQMADIREIMIPLVNLQRQADFRCFVCWIREKELTMELMGCLLSFDYADIIHMMWNSVYPFRCG